jgi:hypothetical protein
LSLYAEVGASVAELYCTFVSSSIRLVPNLFRKLT